MVSGTPGGYSTVPVGDAVRDDGLHQFGGGDQPATAVIENPNPSVGFQQDVAAPSDVSAPRDVDSLIAMLSRPLLLTAVAFPLTTATSPAVTANLMASYLSSPAIASRIAYVRHIRASVCLRIEMPVNPHMYGEAFCAMMPQPLTSNGSFSLARYYQQPVSGVFNANTGNPVILKYPFLWYNRKLALGTSNPDLPYYNQLVVAPLSPLGRDDAVAVGTPYLNVYMWLEDVQLSDSTPYASYGPRGQKGAPARAPRGFTDFEEFRASAQSGDWLEPRAQPGGQVVRRSAPVTRAMAVAREGGPGVFSTLAASVGQYARLLAPMLPAASVVARVADVVGPLAAEFGWSKPNQRNAAPFFMPRTAPFLAQGIGHGTATPLTLDPATMRDVNPGVGSEAEDVLAFTWWTRKWGWLGNSTYSTTTTAGTILAAIPVTPYIQDMNSEVIIPAGVPALATERWIGSMEYRMTIAATPYHRGKLLLAYVPSNLTSTALTVTQLMTTCHNAIVDVSQSTDVCVRVGWTQNSSCGVFSWASSPADVADGNIPSAIPGPVQMSTSNALYPATELTELNGQLVVVAFDALSATAAGSLLLNFWARGGPDLQFGGAAGGVASQYVALGPAATADDFAQAAPQIPDEGVAYHMGGDMVATGHMGSLWGDEMVSFRPMLKRLTPTWTIVPWPLSNTVSPVGGVTWLKFNVPAYPPTVRPTTASNPLGMQTSTNAVGVVFQPSLYSLLQSMFIGVGGSMNHCVIPDATVATASLQMWAAAADTAAYSGVNSGGNVWYGNVSAGAPPSGALGRVGVGGEYVYSGASSAATRPLEVAVKHPSALAYVSPGSSAVATPGPFGYEVNIVAGSSTASGLLKGGGFHFLTAAGEDFQVFGFVGTPSLAAYVANQPHSGFAAL